MSTTLNESDWTQSLALPNPLYLGSFSGSGQGAVTSTAQLLLSPFFLSMSNRFCK